jgi:hypothetical protein
MENIAEVKEDAELRLSIIAEWLKPGSSLLDLGARYGFGYKHLLAKNIKITAVDLNPEVLAKIQQDPRVQVVNKTIEDFVKHAALNNLKWDAAFLGNVIEHIPLHEWYALLHSTFDVTTRIIISTPYNQVQFDYVKFNIEQYVTRRPYVPDIHKVFNITSELFQTLGFHVVRSTITKRGTPRHKPDNIIRYRARDAILRMRKWHDKDLIVELVKSRSEK